LKSTGHIYLLGLGHLTCDVTQGAIPALLPFLVTGSGLSYAQAATLVFACSIVSSVIQPLFGWLGDRVDRPWLMAVGVLLSGVGISLIGWASSYAWMLVCMAITGIGVAVFHPEGGKLATVIAEGGKATGFSNFSVGGYVGFAIGPALVTLLLGLFGLKGTAFFILPTLLVAVILLTQTSRYRQFVATAAGREAADSLTARQDDWRGFSKVTLLNLFRSILGNGISTFLPLFLIASFAISPYSGAMVLTAYSSAGAVATFLGGRLGDRVGLKKLILIGYSLALPLFVAFVLIDQLVLAVVLVVGVALCLSLAYSPLVVLGQGYLPHHLGLSSGISLGIVVSAGGMASPLLGLVGDNWGLLTAMYILIGVAVLATSAALILYRHRGRAAADQASKIINQ